MYLGDVDNDVYSSDVIDYLTGAGIKVLKVVLFSSGVQRGFMEEGTRVCTF